MEPHEDIGQPLDTYTEGASTKSRRCNVRDRIVRHVNAPVRVGDDHANNVFETLEVERAIVINADRQGDRCQRTDSWPRGRRKLHNLGA